DVVPLTPIGKLIAAVTIFCGLVMVALPVGLIATAVSEMIHRRDFVVTWRMIAKLPLFAAPNAGDIADVTRLLRAQTGEADAALCGAHARGGGAAGRRRRRHRAGRYGHGRAGRGGSGRTAAVALAHRVGQRRNAVGAMGPDADTRAVRDGGERLRGVDAAG